MAAPPVSLREYIEVRLLAMETAVTKAEIAAEKRFEAINEMRAMVTDAARSYLPRQEYETSQKAMMERIEFLQSIVMPRSEFDIKFSALEQRLNSVQKFIWIGVGIVATLQFVIGTVVIIWKHN